jgi:hypothetical protein
MIEAWVLVVGMMGLNSVITPMRSREDCVIAARLTVENDPDGKKGISAVCVPLLLPPAVCGDNQGD